GYFLCQLSASYGNQQAPDGQKLTHVIDAIGAVGAFRIANGQVSFAAQYYPARPYKIWDFYNRNMSKASVAWTGWSKYNRETMSQWQQLAPNPDTLYTHPNVDFWKVGAKLVAATEVPQWVGYEFRASTLDDFKVFGPVFNSTDDLPLWMAVHERYDENGTLWGSFISANVERRRFTHDGGRWLADYDANVPMRFLLFNKEDRTWATKKPIELNTSMFITHQLNAYERSDGVVVADMIAYANDDPYDKYLRTDFVMSHAYPSTAKVLRFTIDVATQQVTYDSLTPEAQISAEYPQINHAFDNRPYRWAYLVETPYAADNAILKINVDDPTGASNRRFKAESSLVLHEPWFVQRPNAHREDDGVLLVRALDVSIDRGKSIHIGQ
ncbi:Protein F49E10.2 a, partial [Aphelenchoides avenae]